MSYWDSSALLKLYAREADSDRFEMLERHLSKPLATSWIATYELRSAFQRKVAEGVLGRGASVALYQEVLIDCSQGLIFLIEHSGDIDRQFQKVLAVCYERTPAIFLRTLDGLHLASALLHGETDFVTADLRLRQAAQAMGLRVLP